jgi:hypothetical protein
MADQPRKEANRRVQFLRNTMVARHIVGEVPSKQSIQEFRKDTVEEFGENLATSLVRGRQAKFVSKEEQTKFEESERTRLEAGMYLNDRERDAWLRSQDVVIEKDPVPVRS